MDLKSSLKRITLSADFDEETEKTRSRTGSRANSRGHSRNPSWNSETSEAAVTPKIRKHVF
jgi:hypothetical protein